MAGTMKVEIWYEMIDVELIDESCLVSWDMPVTKFFADDSSILALYQSVVSTGTCSTFGLCYVEFVEEVCYGIIDEFRAIVWVEIYDDKGEVGESHPEYWKKIGFTDTFDRYSDFPLCHLIHEIDVVDTFLSIQITLMNRINPDESRRSIGTRFCSCTNGNLGTLCAGNIQSITEIHFCSSQTVEMSDWYLLEANESLISCTILILHESDCQSSGKSIGGIIHLCQEFYVCRAVLFRKVMSGEICTSTRFLTSLESFHMPTNLFTRQSCHANQIPHNERFFLFGRHEIPKPYQSFPDPLSSHVLFSLQLNRINERTCKKGCKFRKSFEARVIKHSSHMLQSNHDFLRLPAFEDILYENAGMIWGTFCMRQEYVCISSHTYCSDSKKPSVLLPVS